MDINLYRWLVCIVVWKDELINQNSSFHSLTFLWITRFAWKESFKRFPITLSRLRDLPLQFDADTLHKEFSVYWEKEMSRVCEGRQPRLFVALFRAFTLTFCFVVFVSLFFFHSITY